MEDIIDMLEGFVDAVLSVFDFVASIIEDTLYVIKLTGDFLLHIPSYFAWLPPSYLAIIVAIFGIVVVYKVLGREG